MLLIEVVTPLETTQCAAVATICGVTSPPEQADLPKRILTTCSEPIALVPL
ncbi:unannotated protein [freshwater metagenome]|uniref:Unannotated protein n=1 Tax=freshwater metagenome TaxID=449393 RepID=A0A6J6BJE3_9ZZZZ